MPPVPERDTEQKAKSGIASICEIRVKKPREVSRILVDINFQLRSLGV